MVIQWYSLRSAGFSIATEWLKRLNPFLCRWDVTLIIKQFRYIFCVNNSMLQWILYVPISFHLNIRCVRPKTLQTRLSPFVLTCLNLIHLSSFQACKGHELDSYFTAAYVGCCDSTAPYIFKGDLWEDRSDLNSDFEGCLYAISAMGIWEHDWLF